MARVNLSKREWTVVALGVIFLAAIITAPLLGNAMEAYKRSETQLRQARENLQSARDLRAEIEAGRSGQNAILEKVRARPGRFNLFSFLNGCLSELKLTERADLQDRGGFAVRDSLSMVRMDLKGLSMQELVDLLHRIYASNNLIVVQKATIRATRDAKGLDCDVTFMSPKT